MSKRKATELAMIMREAFGGTDVLRGMVEDYRIENGIPLEVFTEQLATVAQSYRLCMSVFYREVEENGGDDDNKES